MMNRKIKCITLCGILTALAMIFSYIESLVIIPLPVPGIKIGLANIAIITILYVIGIKEAVIVNIIRISLMALLFGNITSFMFSMAGGLLSIIIMVILKHINSVSLTGLSIAGAVSHNIGQIIAAVVIMQTSEIIYYLPVLLISGIVTGIIIGIISAMMITRVQRIADNFK